MSFVYLISWLFPLCMSVCLSVCLCVCLFPRVCVCTWSSSSMMIEKNTPRHSIRVETWDWKLGVVSGPHFERTDRATGKCTVSESGRFWGIFKVSIVKVYQAIGLEFCMWCSVWISSVHAKNQPSTCILKIWLSERARNHSSQSIANVKMSVCSARPRESNKCLTLKIGWKLWMLEARELLMFFGAF